MRLWEKAILLLIVVILLSPPLYYTSGFYKYFKIIPSTLFENDNNKLHASGYPPFRLTHITAQYVQESEKVLVFRQADFAFYGKTKYVSHLDPVLLPLFKTKSSENARRLLLEHGLRYVLLPDYPEPAIYNSVLSELLAAPEFTQLLYRYKGYRLFKILRPAENVIMGRKMVYQILFNSTDHDKRWSIWDSSAKYNSKSWSAGHDENGVTIYSSNSETNHETHIATGRGPLSVMPRYSGQDILKLAPGRYYRLQAEVEGEGIIQIQTVRYSWNEEPVLLSLWDGVLSNDKRIISAIFSSEEKEKEQEARLVFKLFGDGKLNVKNTVVYDEGIVQAAKDPKSEAIAYGWSATTPGLESELTPWGVFKHNGRRAIKISQLDRRPCYLCSTLIPIDKKENYVSGELSLTLAGAGNTNIEVYCDNNKNTLLTKRLYLSSEYNQYIFPLNRLDSCNKDISLMFKIFSDEQYTNTEMFYSSLYVYNINVKAHSESNKTTEIFNQNFSAPIERNKLRMNNCQQIIILKQRAKEREAKAGSPQ